MKDKVIDLLKTNYGNDIEIYRIIEDDNYISIHFKKDNFAKINIYKKENDNLLELIVNSQEIINDKNPSGHTMFDGTTEVNDKDKTQENKQLVEKLENAMMSGNTSDIPSFFDGDNYINHNPKAYDGLTGFAKGMEERRKSGIITKYDKVSLIFAEGNFVQSVVEGTMNEIPMLFCDIFRVENGKIAEHWDVVAEKN